MPETQGHGAISTRRPSRDVAKDMTTEAGNSTAVYFESIPRPVLKPEAIHQAAARAPDRPLSEFFTAIKPHASAQVEKKNEGVSGVASVQNAVQSGLVSHISATRTVMRVW